MNNRVRSQRKSRIERQKVRTEIKKRFEKRKRIKAVQQARSRKKIFLFHVFSSLYMYTNLCIFVFVRSTLEKKKKEYTHIHIYIYTERERERETNNMWRRRDEKDGRTRGEGSMPVARATTAPDLHPSWTILLSPAPFTRTNENEKSSRISGAISRGGYIALQIEIQKKKK